VRVFFDVRIVFGQDFFQKLVFFFSLRLQHILAVMRVKEKLSRLGIRDEFHEVVISADGSHVAGSVDVVELSDFLEDIRGVAFEFEGVCQGVWGSDVRGSGAALWRKRNVLHFFEVCVRDERRA
jgi:hypothetical protein